MRRAGALLLAAGAIASSGRFGERDLLDRRRVGKRRRDVERIGRRDRRADHSSERAIERRLRVGDVALVRDQVVVGLRERRPAPG